ncbi:MAG: ATP-binding protein [Chitinophagales bacterium]
MKLFLIFSFISLINETILHICISGSNANLLSGELATFLSGRYIEIEVYSLSFQEFISFHKLDANKESLKKYMTWGGLPFLHNLNQEEDQIFDYLKNINATILYKDIISRFQIRNTHFLENLMTYLANNTGNVISAKKISDYLKSQQIKMSPQIVLNYLDYLKQAMLIYNVKRTEINGKKVFEINEKFYFEDWGLMNSLIGFSNIDLSRIIENVIYIHLRINNYEVYIGKIGEKEIDFVATKNGNKLYIQASYLIASESIKDREFGNLLEIEDNYPKLVVSLDEYAPKNVKGIRHLHLLDFLSSFEL